jgi:hypothetical protein
MECIDKEGNDNYIEKKAITERENDRTKLKQ